VALPVEAEKYIRFQLERLAARNEHHVFEEICCRIAKRRLSTNLLPATGPVSVGGDQGRDAESYRFRPTSMSAMAGIVPCDDRCVDVGEAEVAQTVSAQPAAGWMLPGGEFGGQVADGRAAARPDLHYM
jgi:hypothetical protein